MIIRTRRTIALAAALALVHAGAASAQDRTPAEHPPHQRADSSHAQMNAMMPMMGQMMAVMLRSSLEVLAQPETAEKMATFNRNYFDALVQKGFTREEALRLVSAVGIPMLSGSR